MTRAATETLVQSPVEIRMFKSGVAGPISPPHRGETSEELINRLADAWRLRLLISPAHQSFARYMESRCERPDLTQYIGDIGDRQVRARAEWAVMYYDFLLWVFAFILQAALLGKCMYTLITLSDLESDHTNPFDCALAVNRFVVRHTAGAGPTRAAVVINLHGVRRARHACVRGQWVAWRRSRSRDSRFASPPADG